MKPFSFIFAGTSKIALDVLKLLLESKSLTLQGAVSRPDSLQGRGMKKQSSAVKSFIKSQNIPLWAPQKASDPAFLSEIKERKCDFSFVCSYGRILPLSYLQLFPKGALNLHFSQLPYWRGAAPVQRALMAGDQKTAVSLQLMTEDLDAGDIIGQKIFKINETDNAEDIFNKALKNTKHLIKKELIKYLEGKLKPQAQDHSQKTYAYKIDKEEARIKWQKSAQALHNQIRALYLGPQAFFTLQGKRIKVYRAEALKKEFPHFKPGEIGLVEKSRLLVACGSGVLSLLELKKEGKQKLSIEDFLKGCPLKLKDKLD